MAMPTSLDVRSVESWSSTSRCSSRCKVVLAAPPEEDETQRPAAPLVVQRFLLLRLRQHPVVVLTRLIYPPVVLFGRDDTFPAPGAGFYPDSGETGGSMHVGPNDPCFFPSTPSTPFGDPGSVPPGGRYDPIGPPDVPGFEPSRFVRRSRHSGGSTHPDLEFFQQDPDFF
ncbi:probable proteasome inhibitor [Triticum aestivum]|uniref:probable proteasome inhibitor n=1 Tax=Triticum aestivum TaxID=4565 RepID=UPI001D016046|nr:probable proteasome inhibitor [Triticum aestivum]